MKKNTLLFFFFLLISTTCFSQNSEIVITTKYDEFELYINNKEMTEGSDTIVELKNIIPGTYNLVITFEADTIADINKKIKVKPNKKYLFEIKPKSKFARKITKKGRELKKTNDNNLIDYYFLELIDIKAL